jgi:NitT/TauT family transport system substrate-binding protein
MRNNPRAPVLKPDIAGKDLGAYFESPNRHRPEKRLSMKQFRSMMIGFAALTLISAVAQPGLSQETKRFGFAVSTPVHYLPVWLAKEAGLYSKHGLDVEVIWIRSGAMAMMAIVSGQLPLSGVGAASVVSARAEGADIELLACPLDGDVVYFITRPEIKSPEQLKGKATGVTRLGQSVHFYLRTALKHLGLDPDRDMTVLQLGVGAEIAAALESGRIAAAPLSFRDSLPFVERGWPIMLDLTNLIKYPPSCVASTRAFVRANPNTVERYLKAYTEAIHVIKTNPPLAKKVYAKIWRESNTQVIDKVVDHYVQIFKSVPTIPTAGLETAIRDLASRKPLSKEFMQPEMYKDDAPLQKLIKEGWFEQLKK